MTERSSTRRLLILNDSDPWMMRKRDVRGWLAHGLWFASAGDVVVVMDALPDDFVDHVLAVKGLGRADVRIVTIPDNAMDFTSFDPQALCSSSFVASVRDLIGEEHYEADALWWTRSAIEFVVGVGAALPVPEPSRRFFEANGYELANSKGAFRALASTAGVGLPAGAVAYSIEEAIDATRRSLREGRAVMAKRAHGGAGGANHLLHTTGWAGDHQRSGATRATGIDIADPDSISGFWAAEWEWMSNGGGFSVVVEEFIDDAETFYCEFRISAHSIGSPHVGQLVFEDGGLAVEIHPRRPEAPGALEALVRQACELAELYRRIGYAGVLSADAVVGPDGSVLFTEVNARYTGSTHLYEVMAALPDRRGRGGERVVYQATTSASVSPTTLSQFLSYLRSHDVAYDPETGCGAIVLTQFGTPGGGGPLMYNVVADTFEDAERMARVVSGFASSEGGAEGQGR